LCSVTYTVTVTPLAGPDVDLDPNLPGIGCADTDIQLGLINNQPGVQLSYSWSATPPLVLTGSTNPIVSGPAGNYVVTVTITNLATNCTETLEVPVQIDSLQSIQQDITADLCDGTNVQFFNNSGLSGTWNFGDNSTSVEPNPIHQYSAGGQYQVTFTPDNAVCTAPWDSLITVYEAALQPPVIANNYVVCVNQAEIQFNGTSNIPNVTWSWTFEGGNPTATTTQNPLVTFTTEGSITASVTVTDMNGCVDSSEAAVEVIFINDNIVETIEYCIDSTLLYLNADGIDSTAQYSWTSNPPDPNLNATDPNPGVSPDVQNGLFRDDHPGGPLLLGHLHRNGNTFAWPGCYVAARHGGLFRYGHHAGSNGQWIKLCLVGII
jgi:PKD repeat protein